MKKIIGTLMVMFSLLHPVLLAQNTFEKWIGGPYDGDIGFNIIPVDGGYLIAASWTIDYGESWDTETDAALIKINEDGEIVWRTMIPTIERYTGADKLNKVIPTQDDGYIATGIIQTANAVGKEDVLVAKFTSSGDTVWTKRYDFDEYDCGNAIIQSGDGGYIIVGRSGPLGNDNILFFKIDADGDTVWTRAWGGSYADRLNDIVMTADNNFYAAGCIQPSYVLNRYLVKLNANGDTLWTKTATGGESISIRTTGDGGYILAEKQALTKINSDGDEQWRKEITTFLGINGGHARLAIPVSGGGYVATGKSDEIDITNPFGSANKQLFITKFTATGDTVWTKRFGINEFNKNDEGYSVVETADGGYLAIGFTCLNQSSVVTNYKDIYLVKVNSEGVTAINPKTVSTPAVYSLSQNFPNPFNPSTTIRYALPERSTVRLTIYNMLGKEVRTLVNTVEDAGYKSIIWDGLDQHGRLISTGVYIYKIQAGNFTQTRKMVFMK